MSEQSSTMTQQYRTLGGIVVHRTVESVTAAPAVESLIDRLDAHRGVLLSSSYEYPGRYTRWDLGFADPPLSVWARQREVHIDALNARGAVLLPAVAVCLGALDDDRVESASIRPDFVESVSIRTRRNQVN